LLFIRKGVDTLSEYKTMGRFPTTKKHPIKSHKGCVTTHNPCINYRNPSYTLYRKGGSPVTAKGNHP